VVAAVLAGCAGPPSPPARAPAAPLAPLAPRAPRPAVAAPEPTTVLSLALVAGGWHGYDDDQWQYDLDIQTDATFTQIVRQPSDAECQQTGTLVTGATEILRTFRDNECNHEYDGKTVHDRVISIDGAHMVLQMESDYLIHYDLAR
jgi:hypothetical protein